MRKRLVLYVFLASLILALNGIETSQGANGSPEPVPVRRYSVRNDLSPALREIPPEPPRMDQSPQIPKPVAPVWGRDGNGVPNYTPDPVLQSQDGAPGMPAPIINFEGLSNEDNIAIYGFGVAPPDANGDIGLNHYVQWNNITFAIWWIDRPNGAAIRVYGPAAGSTLWSGFGGLCETHNDGDPIVLYDSLANRWLMSQMAWGFSPDEFHQCVAVSQSSDPTGAWYRYDFLVSTEKINDYPKLGVWPDGYYLAMNQFAKGVWAGQGVAVFEREKMLAGQPAAMVYFDLQGPYPTLGRMLPADIDGQIPPPAGAPNLYAQIDDNAWGYSPDQLQLWQFHVDWVNPAISTFTNLTVFNLSAMGLGFDAELCSTYREQCVTQPGTDLQLEVISDRLMHRLAYRNFGDHASLVLNHTVDVDGLGRAGIRWYEVQLTGGAVNLTQAGTYAPTGPDGDQQDHRWMGSIAMDHGGNIALGYSISGVSTYPSIRYAGRLAGDPPGQLTQGETTLFAGNGSQVLMQGRWGDYTMLGVDPTDDCTFWYVNEYYPVTDAGRWHTRIGAFKLPICTTGERGNLRGRVTDLATGDPVPNASVSIPTGIATTTDANGIYQLLNLATGTYEVMSEAYGYLPETATGVSVSPGSTTTQDFGLVGRLPVQVQGVVTDAGIGQNGGHGWPMYARIDITGEGYANSTFTDPLHGTYQVNLFQGEAYTFTVSAFSNGYTPLVTTWVYPATQQPARQTPAEALDFALTIDGPDCTAPGYAPELVYFENFEGGDGGYTTTAATPPSNSTWAWGVPTSGPDFAFSGEHAWATNLAGNYANQEDSSLVSPAIDLSAYAGLTPILTWKQSLVTELYYDFASLEVSADNGQSWRRVYGEVSGQVDTGWVTKRVTLSPSDATSGFRLRFRLLANNVITAPGWYIDDIGIGMSPAPGTTIYFEDFEASNGGYTAHNTTSWAWGNPTSGPGSAHSGQNVWGTNLAGDYGDNEDGYLLTPEIPLAVYTGQTPVLTWWQWLETESGFDFVSVEVSRDRGQHWKRVYSEVSGSIDAAWTQHLVVLDPIYTSGSIWLRFRLISDLGVTAPGWYLDDVQIVLLPDFPTGVCASSPGGLLIGNVTGLSLGAPIAGVRVSHVTTGSTVTLSTPDDPMVGDGFYILFAPPGLQEISAAFGDLQVSQVATLTEDQIWVQDFVLPALQLLMPLVVKQW